MITLEKHKKTLQALTELLLYFSDQMNHSPELSNDPAYIKDLNIILDEILIIKKELGTKQFNTIKYVLREKYPSQQKRPT